MAGSLCVLHLPTILMRNCIMRTVVERGAFVTFCKTQCCSSERNHGCQFPILFSYRISFQLRKYFFQYRLLCFSMSSSSLDKPTKANSMKQNLVNLFCIVEGKKSLLGNPRSLNLHISENVGDNAYLEQDALGSVRAVIQ